jgi:hypothetical protein
VSIGRGGGAMSAEPSSGVAATPNGGEPTPSGTQPSLSGAEPTPGAQPAPNDAPPSLSGGAVMMRIIGGFGALLGYGCLAAFLLLISA